MPKESSGLLPLAISCIVVALLSATPFLFQWFGVAGVVILLVFVVIAIYLNGRESPEEQSKLAEESTQEPHRRQKKHRPQRGKHADARGLRFYDLKAKPHGSSESDTSAKSAEGEAAKKAPALERSISKDQDGNTWEFTEILSHRSVSVLPVAPEETEQNVKPPPVLGAPGPPITTQTLLPTAAADMSGEGSFDGTSSVSSGGPFDPCSSMMVNHPSVSSGGPLDACSSMMVNHPSASSGGAQIDAKLEDDLFVIFSAASLLDHLPSARRWCVENGAAFINEVIENVDGLSESLELSDTASAALARACKAGVRPQTQSFPRAPSSSVFRQASNLAKTFSTGLSKTFSLSPLMTSSSRSLPRTSSRCSERGLPLSSTRTVSFLQNQPPRWHEADVEMAEEETDSESEPEPGEEPGEIKIPPKDRRFAGAAKAVLFGVRLGVLGKKRRREEFEATQVTITPVTPPPEEASLDPKSALGKLTSFKGELGCNCITLLVPAGTPTMQSLEKQADGRRTRRYLKLLAAQLPGCGNDIPKNGLGLFLKVYGGDRTDELVAIEPPKPVRKFALSDGPMFATELLVQLFVETAAAGCVVISGEDAIIYRLFEDHGVIEAKINPRLQKRQKKGGQSALRISRLAEEVRAAYVRIVAERANKEFVDEEGAPNVDLFAIGGAKELGDNLHSSDHLNYRLKKIMKRSTAIHEDAPISEVLKEALALKSKVAASVASGLLHELEAQAHTSLAAYGIKDVSKRVEEGNLKKLIFASGCGLSADVINKAYAIKSAKVEEVDRGLGAHEELTRKWGGAFALLCWEPPEDFDEEDG